MHDLKKMISDDDLATEALDLKKNGSLALLGEAVLGLIMADRLYGTMSQGNDLDSHASFPSGIATS